MKKYSMTGRGKFIIFLIALGALYYATRPYHAAWQEQYAKWWQEAVTKAKPLMK